MILPMEAAELQHNSGNMIYGAPEGQDARVLAQRARSLMPADKVLMHVALDDARCMTLQELLAFFAPDVRVAVLPAWDCLPYDRVSPNTDIVAQRVAALVELMRWEAEQERYPRILLTTVNAAMQLVMPKDVLAAASLSTRAGGRLDVTQLQVYLANNGYVRTETVREGGEFSIRGGIIDIFPAGHAEPIRMDLFGDEVESIRRFDPLSQRSGEKVSEFCLQPATEFFLDDDSIARFRAGYREAFGVVNSDDPLYAAVSEGRRYNGMDHWLPLFHEHMGTVFDYVPGGGVTFDHHAAEAQIERAAQVRDFYEARKTLEDAAAKRDKKVQDVSLSGSVYHPLLPAQLYVENAAWNALVEGAETLSPFSDPSDEAAQNSARKGRDFADIRALPEGDVFAELKTHVAALSQKALIACYSEGSRERLKGLLEQAGFDQLAALDNLKEVKALSTGAIGLVILHLERGFVADDLVVITEQDILGDRLARRAQKKRKADNFLTEVLSLSEGDLVVHVDHGIGKFVELETVQVGRTFHDCLKVEYAGGDRLFVPVENMEVLSRFGADEGTAQLDKLGGAGWQARKSRVKKDLMAMADGLLKIAAARLLKKADKLDVSEGIYNEFVARFPYAETEDQQRAIDDVIADLSTGHPMDRLVCGDVGFGKTEVAMRAAYVAAMEGVQVAVVVPTTLLARQHYQNFVARFSGTGLHVAQLSRLVAAKDASLVKDGLRDRSVNIVIGTHALFSKEIKFSNLGLLVVDEEQRFGVKQKERLKELKNNVHVLTLTATPIPRTLQMSLTGVREMSLITTPPVDRMAIRTFVMPVDTMVIREALLREHYRGGQSFYVCPRVTDMKDLKEMLAELVPEIKVIDAHGQMTPTELEDRMNAFYDGQYDVLLATNIIESGIDIPTANTMIIHRADMFGLAQLYQIRGRIGRSKVRAYAYLTYQPGLKLNDKAMKRLEIMETLDTLGSGFQLASHDMDIRGGGNLLGDQQSGHVREVGVELYQQMLEEAVAMARQGVDLDDMPEEKWSPNINVGTSVLIPETYVEDLGVRMSLYRRIADLGSIDSLSPRGESRGEGKNSERKEAPPHPNPLPGGRGYSFSDEIESFAAEMIDRFGKLPEELENLLDIVAIKQMCKRAGVASVEAGPKGAVIGFHKDSPPNVAGIMGWITEQRGSVKLRPDQKIVAVRHWDTPAKRVKGVQRLMRELVTIA